MLFFRTDRSSRKLRQFSEDLFGLGLQIFGELTDDLGIFFFSFIVLKK